MSEERRIIYLNPRDLLPSRQKVRSDPGDLAGLAETIREHGILQPLGVTHEGDGYRVVYGNRRRDAAIVVGLDRVPCMIIGDVDEEDVLVQQVLENLQRLDLNDLEKSRAFEHLLARLVEQGASQGEAVEVMARSLGLSARQIQRYLRLRQLSPEVQRLIAQGELGVTHAQHLVEVVPAERQEAVAALVVEESLSAAELSRLCAALERNANIEPRLALAALRRGERIAVVEAKPKEILPWLTARTAPTEETAVVEEGEGSEDNQHGDWVEPSTSTKDREPQVGDFSSFEPTTRDGNRIRKIHTLDSFMDELQRLTQCVQDGDLQRFLDSDDGAKVKVKLAARQARFLADALLALAKAFGPGE